MLNKNVADYTNFDGKTNKRIVQAPGGSSSVSLSWNNQKTDYGPERSFRNKDNYIQNQQQTFIQPPHFNYQQPIKVMEQHPHSNKKIGSDLPHKQSFRPQGLSQNSKRLGGEYGYNNYSPHEYNKYDGGNNTSKQRDYHGQESLELAIQQHEKIKLPNIPKSQEAKKSSIRIHQQKNNLVLGDNNYNYWKENNDSKNSIRRPGSYDRSLNNYEKQIFPEKTSVKVHNPPGGKSSFTLG